VTAAVYVLKVVTPELSPSTGSYGSAQSVALSTTTSGATIRYTTDGSEPTESSTAYSSAVTVDSTQTVKAVAFKTGWSPSDSGFGSYWISAGTVATPTLAPSPDTYDTPQLVTLTTTTASASIRYTLDGSDPTATSPLYGYPFVVSTTTTVKARAFKPGYTASAVGSGAYDLDADGVVETPAVSPGGGQFTTNQSVTITGPTGATLRYTTTGVDPTETDTTITSGNSVTVDRSLVLKVRAWDTGLAPSAVRRADYVLTGAVAAGSYHSLALQTNGTLWGWGNNPSGQIGDGTTTPRSTPVQVLTGGVAAAAGSQHSLAVKADGTVWSWGSPADGRLGPGEHTSPYEPAHVDDTADELVDIVAVAAGAGHSLALREDGTVWAWGLNTSGQLGDGTTTSRETPEQVLGLSGVTAIAAAGDISLAIGSDGANAGVVWAWGANSAGQLGEGSTLTRLEPVMVGGLSDVRQIAAGSNWAMALAADGRLWAWGNNTYGQLGDAFLTTSSTPVPVLPLTDVVTIAAGASHALAVTADGRLWAWGNNESMQAGPRNYYPLTYTWVPQLVSDTAPVRVAAGTNHSLVIRPDGAVYAFGSGNALGAGTGGSTPVPVASNGLAVATNTWLSTDTDDDGLITWREYLLGTDPLNPDSNGDGVYDGIDAGPGSASANPDTDGDGLPNWVEVQLGTDPFNADTDGDMVNDGADAFPLDPSRSTAPSPDPMDTTPPAITLTEPTNATLVE
jgi:alpha-tubulin suppressor-like RCC1 family protein